VNSAPLDGVNVARPVAAYAASADLEIFSEARINSNLAYSSRQT